MSFEGFDWTRTGPKLDQTLPFFTGYQSILAVKFSPTAFLQARIGAVAS
jgi:hypothetical protein